MEENHRVRLISERRLDIDDYLYTRSFVRKNSPTIFTQVFTILGHVPAVIGDPKSQTVALPLVYALLSSKSEEA